MENIEQLHNRYVRLNGMRPTDKSYLQQIEADLGLVLPRALIQTLEFFDGSGFAVLPLHAIATKPDPNVLSETQRLRRSIGLPSQYLVLGEPPESILFLDCQDGSVLWCDAIDAPRLGKHPLTKEPERWSDFLAFFEYLLDEEEADRQ